MKFKDAKRTSFAEFEKWIRGHDSLPAFPRYGTVDEDSAARDAWQAALIWIYYESVLGHSLAGNLIKEELPDGSI